MNIESPYWFTPRRLVSDLVYTPDSDVWRVFPSRESTKKNKGHVQAHGHRSYYPHRCYYRVRAFYMLALRLSAR